MISVFLVGMCMVAAGAGTIREPATGVEFADRLQFDKGTVACTGVDYRTKWFVKAYAIAHYAAPDAWPKTGDVPERLKYWSEAKVLKVFVLKLTYDVGRKRMASAMEEGLDHANYHGPSREGFLRAFTCDPKKGDEVRLVAQADGTLSVEFNKTALGSWQDPELVKALWMIWMGDESVLSNREDLVKRAAP